jgi:thiol-disulfide isomerase/thioredoxin
MRTAAAALLALVAPAAVMAGPLEDLRDRYAALSTYHALITQTRTMIYGAEGPSARTVQQWDYELCFDREGDRLTIRAPWGDIAHAPEAFRLTCRACGVYETLDHETLSFDSISREAHSHAGHLLGLPTLDLLIGDTEHTLAHSLGVTFDGDPRSETLDGVRYTVLPASVPHFDRNTRNHDTETAHRGPAEYWINDETGLLERISIDFTGTDQFDDRSTREYGAISSLIEQFEIEVRPADRPIDPAVFAISTEGLERGPERSTDREPVFSSHEGADFIHEPMPAFTGTTITGEDFSTEALGGKAVLIDFWATWCGPCVAVMPALQLIADEYADKGLIVLGINQDRADQRDKVAAFLNERSLTFTQVLDPDGTLGARFGVSAIPTTILVDAQGVVQAYTVGAHSKEDYTANIDKVLAGETLPMPTPHASPADSIEIVEKIALNTATWPAPVSAWEGLSVRSGEGEAFYMPHDAGGLARLDHATGVLTRVRMPGLPRGRSVTAFAKVDGGIGGWLFATELQVGYSDLEFIRVDENGQRLWSAHLGVDPASEPMHEAKMLALDLDHDGEDEFVIVASVTDTDTWESAVILVVIENDGEILHRAPMTIDGLGALLRVPGDESNRPGVIIFGLNQFVRVSFDL